MGKNINILVCIIDGIIKNIKLMSTNDASFFSSKIKIIFLGDPTVGKTSIISALRQNQFQDKQQATIGIDFFAQMVTKNNQSYKLQFWDTAGQERFRSIIPSYVRNSHVGIIVFDVNNRVSFESVSSWLESFRENSPENARTIILGNKIDSPQRAVSTQEAEQKFTRDNLVYLEISAKTKQNIEKLTEILINSIDPSQSEAEEQEQRTKSYAKLEKFIQELGKNNGKKTKKCCGL